MRSIRAGILNNVLCLGKLARLTVNQALSGSEVYNLASIMRDLRTGIWSAARLILKVNQLKGR